MATIVSETNLITKGECLETQKIIMQEFKEIKNILNSLPKQIMDEANATYVRKDIYDLNMRAMIEEMKTVRENTANLQKNDDVIQKTDNERLFRIIQMSVSIITVLVMAYIATK